MKFTILGCGTSTGVPVLGCKCAVCLGQDRKNRRLRCSAAIICPDQRVILIDTSTDLRHQLLREKIDRVDAVLYTHAHADHILGLEDLRAFNFWTRQPIQTFLTATCLKGIKRSFHYVFERDPEYQGSLTNLHLNIIHHGSAFELFGLTIVPFQLLHGSVEVTGYRINFARGSIAYATDCKVIPDASRSHLRELDLLVLGALRDEPHSAHLTVAEAVAEAQIIAAKKTILVHLSHTIDYSSRNAQLPDNVALAYDGMNFKFA